MSGIIERISAVVLPSIFFHFSVVLEKMIVQYVMIIPRYQTLFHTFGNHDEDNYGYYEGNNKTKEEEEFGRDNRDIITTAAIESQAIHHAVHNQPHPTSANVKHSSGYLSCVSLLCPCL